MWSARPALATSRRKIPSAMGERQMLPMQTKSTLGMFRWLKKIGPACYPKPAGKKSLRQDPQARRRNTAEQKNQAGAVTGSLSRRASRRGDQRPVRHLVAARAFVARIGDQQGGAFPASLAMRQRR